jgi:uncharacterized protein (DUF2147 family)
MKMFAVVFLLAVSAMGADPAPAAPLAQSVPVVAGITGKWKTIDDETGKAKSIVEIYEENGSYSGKIVKLFREPNEEQNPNCDKCTGDKKDKPITGMQILSGLKKDGDKWSGGDILDPKNGKTYSCKAELAENGAKLKLRGFIGFSLLGRTQTWIREP